MRFAGTRSSGAYGLALLAAVVLLGFFAQEARAQVSFCPPGEGAGQCNRPEGVSADSETGRVFIADRGNNRVNVFESDGTFVFAFGWGVKDGGAEPQTCTTASGCQKGIAGSGTGQFSGPRTIAVDNIPGSGARHDVYVGTDNFRVQRFGPEGKFRLAFGWGVVNGTAEVQTCGPEPTPSTACLAGLEGEGECQIGRQNSPIAVGPGGNVFVADTAQGAGPLEVFTGRIEKFSPSGECLDEVLIFQNENRVLRGLAVDSGENSYLILERGGEEIRKYDSSGNVLCKEVDKGTESTALAVDSFGRLFAAQREAGLQSSVDFRTITQYDPSCNRLRRFGYGEIEKPVRGLAGFLSAGGEIFASEEEKGVHYLAQPPLGPIVAGVEADPVSNKIGRAHV